MYHDNSEKTMNKKKFTMYACADLGIPYVDRARKRQKIVRDNSPKTEMLKAEKRRLYR